MHIKKVCPRCNGTGMVKDHVKVVGNWFTGFSYVDVMGVCPNCRGGKTYLVPATNLDLLNRSSESKRSDIISEVCVDSMLEPLLKCYGATLNSFQISFIKGEVKKSLAKFLKEVGDINNPIWGDPAKMNLKDLTPSLEDVLKPFKG